MAGQIIKYVITPIAYDHVIPETTFSNAGNKYQYSNDVLDNDGDPSQCFGPNLKSILGYI